MKLELHPKAVENFDIKILELISQLRFRLEPKRIPKHNPNLHISGHFDETNIVGDLKLSLQDINGNISARMFGVRGKQLGLFDEDYKKLAQIAENLQKSINPKNVVGVEFISDLIFEWLKDNYFGKNKQSPSEFILSECEKNIEEIEIWIPISHLHIETPFKLGNITFKCITKKFMDAYENSIKPTFINPDELIRFEHHFERKRSKFQNLAVATMKIEAEREYAYEIVLQETEKTLSILRLFSPTNIHPTKICYCAPVEKQHLDGKVFFVIKDGKVDSETSGFSDKSMERWNLTNQDLNEYAEIGLGFLGSLLHKKDLTDFQEKLLESLYLYSKASLAKNIADRLVYTLVALETMFLKDANEPIQDNISLRMAFMHPVPVEERKLIVKNIRDTYALRSSFIHHGKNISIEDLDTLKKFMIDTWLCMIELVTFASRNVTRQQFFDELETRRLSG
jgi:hypothetical protein